MVWYAHLFQNFPQFIVIHTVKGFGIINKAEIDIFLELSCFFDDPTDVGNLISGSSAFSKTSLNIWKCMVHILLKPGLENFEHYFTSIGISELRWTGMGEFNSDDHYIYYCGQESFRRNRVAIMVKKKVQNAVLGCSLKNDRMISVCFQGKAFNIMEIQAYAPTSNTEEAEDEWFYEDLQDLLELTPEKDVLFIIGDWNAKSRKSGNT